MGYDYFIEFEGYREEKAAIARVITTTLSEKYIYPRILDVGSGAGIISRKLAKIASEVVCLEPNDVLYQLQYNELIKNKIDNIILHKKTFQSFISIKKFDVIVLSHVLIHIPFKEFFILVSKLLINNGLLVIIQHSRYSPQLCLEKALYARIKKDAFEYFDAESVVDVLAKKKFSASLSYIATQIISKSRHEILRLLSGFLGICGCMNVLNDLEESQKMIKKRKNGYYLKTIHGIILASQKH